MSGEVALQLNAIGMVSTLAASPYVAVVTRPTDIAVKVATHDYDALIIAIGHQLGAWIYALVRFI